MNKPENFIKKLKEMNSDIQTELIKKYNSRLFLYFKLRIKGDIHYEDLVQEVFTSFFEGVKKNKVVEEKFIGPFIFGIAKRVLYNFFYKKKRDETIQNKIEDCFEISYNYEEEERHENERMGRIINESIDHLPEIDKIILKEFYLKENSIGEIANFLGKSKHYVSVRKVRALKKIKNEILKSKNVYYI